MVYLRLWTIDMSLLSSVLFSVKDFTHWHTEASFNISSDVFITKFKSNLTGLRVVLTKTGSPIVHLYICLATDANTDEGLPHALEHLIFLGSEKYPYKAVLDILANRLLASRANAWTDDDHTCYTMSTAGLSGFISMLPVYLDHILYPLLRPEAFATEVHHVDKEGNDAGVVFSEMKVKLSKWFNP